MIYSLRRKFIRVSALSILIVFFAIFSVMFLVNNRQLNRTMDTLTDAIASNGGVFPEFEASRRAVPSEGFYHNDIITEETRFSTRFFTVRMDGEEETVTINVDSVFSISEEQALNYAKEALKKGKERGWVSDYRFKSCETENGTVLVFVNGEMNRMMTERSLLSFLLVLGGSGLFILILIILISKRVVRPVAESYEKQKQFITDANHELKTPLTLILSNLDIVESEVGKNEWLDDIRCEGERMRMLVNQLVALSRMDEDRPNLNIARFSLSDAAADTISEFKQLARDSGKTLSADVEPAVECKGDEGMIRRLMAILLDNAVKYCDEKGAIQVAVYEKHHPVITVENTCANVENMELGRLFDRFYRADRARTFDGSFGVGLSIAKAIARKHRGDICAYKKENLIGFRVDLK